MSLLVGNKHRGLIQAGQTGLIGSYDSWYNSIPKYKNDTSDYSLKLAYDDLVKTDEGRKMLLNFSEGDGHLYDTYKKPTHITFSTESLLSKGDTTGGVWGYDDKRKQDVFTPSEFNLKQYSPEQYKEYFDKYEKGVILNLK